MKVFRSLANTVNISANGGSIHLNYGEIRNLIIFLNGEYPELFLKTMEPKATHSTKEQP